MAPAVGRTPGSSDHQRPVMSDPYRLLNLPRGADQAAIKQAYRKLAKSLHPDRNPGDSAAEQRFKEVTQAYDLLSDPAKRARFDRGEIDAEGRPRGFGGFAGGGFDGFAARRGSAARGTGEGLFEKMFGGAFARGFAGADAGRGAAFEEFARAQSGARARMRGADRRYRLEVDLVLAARGGRQRLQLTGGRTIEVDVPAGTESGKRLRLKGQGDASALDGPPGDALVEIRVRPHPQLRREGRDIHCDVALSLADAVLGSRVTVPTLDGQVRLTVPPGASSGRSFRLKGKGIAGPGDAQGDQYVRLLVVLPEPPDRELEAWARRHAGDGRRDHD
jgi:DnaJ-class molecular chaperone